MTKISVPFEYKLADDYLAQTGDLDNKGNWTYDGEDKIWVFVDKMTNKLRHTHYLTEAENGADVPEPADMYKVMLDCNENPLLCTLFGADEHKDYNDLEQLVEELPDGYTYSRPKDPTPDHTYEIMDVTYNSETGKFNEPYPWKKPFMTWEDKRQMRNIKLLVSDDKELPDMPEALRNAWAEYRQKLRDLPQVHGASHGGEIPATDPWKVRFPLDPDGME